MVARRGYTRHLVAMIVSGGQTGVDRAALDVAVSLGLARGGWCPHGRRAEDGRVPDRYPLAETPSPVSLQRTLWNVRDADATLILAAGRLRGGTLLTFRFARRLGKPCLVRDPFATRNLAAARDWLGRHRVRVLNAAGPRARQCPFIHRAAAIFLARILASAGGRHPEVHQKSTMGSKSHFLPPRRRETPPA